jgi:YfiH family protein
MSGWTRAFDSSVPLWVPEGNGNAVLAFSTRRGGISRPPYDSLNVGKSTADEPRAVEENRRRILATLGLDIARLATAGQVHGADIREVEDAGLHSRVDGLLTRRPGLAIVVTTADCLPILLVAPGVVAAVHCGWRGAAAGIARAAVAAVCRAGAVGPDRVTAHLGPCIRSCCYEVGAEVAARFEPEARIPVGDRLHLDIPAATRIELARAGVPEAAIHEVEACTSCEAQWFFSHRRDRGTTGRHWAVAALV